MQVDPLINKLHFYNPWWVNGKVPQELSLPFERPILDIIISYISLPRIAVMKGPRRTGKTTLLFQIANRLIHSGKSPHKVLYFSFDEIENRSNLEKIVEAYELATKKRVTEQGTVYFLLDEIQYLDRWSFQIKKYFDRKLPISFIVSGSSASLIKKGSESLAGRTVEELISPFSFYEYVLYRADKTYLKEKTTSFFKQHPLFSSLDSTLLSPCEQDIRLLFSEYFYRGGFPHVFEIKEKILWSKLLREDILEKVIFRDLVELYGVKKPMVLEKMLLYLIDHSSEILNISNLANSLKLSREYTEKYFEYLQNAFLVFGVSRFAPSIEKIIRSNKKVYSTDVGLMQLTENLQEGRLAETLVAQHLRKQNIGYHRNRYEVDLVVSRGKRIFPVEVKYTNDVSFSELKGLLNFMENSDLNEGWVITRNYFANEKWKNKDIHYIPCWMFLLTNPESIAS